MKRPAKRPTPLHQSATWLLLALLLPLQALATTSEGANQQTSLADLPPGAAPAIVRALAKDLPRSYQPQAESNTYSLTNPGHDLKMTLTESGPSIQFGDQQWQMRLTGFGYQGKIEPIPATSPSLQGERLVYQHAGLDEWYINSRWGIEQGFTVPGPPQPVRTDQDLVLELTLSNPGQVRLTDNTLLFGDAQGQQLRYAGLTAFDAKGTTLPARLALHERTLQIHVETEGAQYPLTIDPWLQKTELTATDLVELVDHFGYAIAMDGDTLVVGAYGSLDNSPGLSQMGAAYVFNRQGATWLNIAQVAKLTPSDRYQHDQFGHSVAIDGDTIIIGAPQISTARQGVAYVFTRPDTGWQDMTETARLSTSAAVSYDHFGITLAIDDDTVVVGAPNSSSTGYSSAGAAYVFTRPDTGWQDMTQTALLTAEDARHGDQFGCAVALDDDTIVVGANSVDHRIFYYTNVGAAYLFTRPDTGWQDMIQTAILTPSDGTSQDLFGSTVAIDNDTIVVGAPTNQISSGEAYVFTQPESGWQDMVETAILTSSDGNTEDMFGAAVAIDNDTIVVGAPGEDDYDYLENYDSGAAYIFIKPETGWQDMTQATKLTANDQIRNANFGSSLTIANGGLIIGAPWQDKGSGVLGSIYIYTSSSAFLPWSMLLLNK